MKPLVPCLAAFALYAVAPSSSFAEDASASLAIRNHRFEPDELHVPAGRRIRLTVSNFDAAAEEFESHEMNREKVIPGNGSASLFIGPLAPGRYPFFGEFHESSARGVVVAE